jgi:hypothetical protein
MPYDIADSVPLAWDVADAAGAPTDATTVTLTITLPDGTTVSPSVTNPPAVTGQYRVTYVPAVEGRYSWRAVTTVPNTAYQDVFEVREAVSPSLLSLSDAKEHLNITGTSSDEELREYLEAATEVVESYVGPVVRRSYTTRVQGGRNVIILPRTQVLSVTALTSVQNGTSPVQLANLSIDTEAGDIYLKTGGCFPCGPFDITYTVGRTYVKANWTLAAKIIVKHNWETQLGNLPSVQGDSPGYIVTGSGYLVPYRAVALLNLPSSAQPLVY